MEKLFSVVFLVLSIVVLSYQKREQFCPLERNGNQCRSSRDQFKCGAFFMDLDGQNETVRWVSALPDMLLKPSVRKSTEMRSVFKNIHKKSFRTIPGFCNEIYANQKCFRMMKKFSKIPLDSCDYSFFNEDSVKTVGDILCEKAKRFAPGQHFQSFVKIGFYHSGCGGNWTETTDKENHLQLEEELCCRYIKGQGRFFRCDGSHFRKRCPNAEPEPIEGGEKRIGLRVVGEPKKYFKV